MSSSCPDLNNTMQALLEALAEKDLWRLRSTERGQSAWTAHHPSRMSCSIWIWASSYKQMRRNPRQCVMCFNGILDFFSLCLSLFPLIFHGGTISTGGSTR